MGKNCPYCGRELRCIGGYYAPLFEQCECEKRAREQALRESEEFRKRVWIQRATCHHEWELRTQDNYTYECCSKCGETRPIGGGDKWY